ncbi:MAG: type II toxin-antitoxin system VapC family toxin [Alphaproteobacteria bacterium]|nr:type II toxin-antitoxin system VapC family toxin [Alphaproteobacteria bacterium]
MIVLDTNVISAIMRRDPDTHVAAWLDSQPPESVWTTTVTVFEIRFGLELLPAGRRRQELETAFDRALAEDFLGRVLKFDQAAAIEAASIAARRRLAGQSVEFRDTQIAGIVLARRAILATRNVRHFADIATQVVDPWAAW